MTALRIHGFEPVSEVNGPGRRAVVWVQGCTLGCPGCFNPGTHGSSPRASESADDVFGRIRALGPRIDGVTISGGEPLQQWDAIVELLGRIRFETRLTTIVFTGYEWPRLRSRPGIELLRERVDVLIAGRYRQEQRLGRGLRGSANKRVLTFGDRLRAEDLDDVPDAEVVIRPDGVLSISGIDPPVLQEERS